MQIECIIYIVVLGSQLQDMSRPDDYVSICFAQLNNESNINSICEVGCLQL